MIGETWFYVDEKEAVAAGFTISKLIPTPDLARAMKYAFGGAVAEAQIEIAQRFDPLTRAIFWGPWRRTETEHVFEFRIDGIVYEAPRYRSVYVMPERLRSHIGYRPIASTEFRRGWARQQGDALKIYTGDSFDTPIVHLP